jgi:activating signal cointegrator complex subunit 3
MRYIAASLERPMRFVGLSTALANAADLADWLGIGRKVGGFGVQRIYLFTA